MNDILKHHLKNIIGRRTKRKLVAFSVDDYGSVRLASKKAKDNLISSGVVLTNRFDNLDTLETDEDLSALFDVLAKHKDAKGNYACFTPIALCANINFSALLESSDTKYIYEPLDVTYSKREENKNTLELIKEGVREKLFVPEFHGREHLNIRVFEKKLREKDIVLLENIRNESFAGIGDSGIPNIHYPSAFSFERIQENTDLIEIAKDGLKLFEKIYGYRAKFFNAPNGNESRIIHQTLNECGIKYVDKKRFNKEHLGDGRYKTEFYYSGKKNKHNQTYIVKNCVFEPNDYRGFDWVNNVVKQMEAAFFWHQPVIISSHRVNFCGQIDESNRRNSLLQLDCLLQRILKKWPDVEFVTMSEIGDEVS